MPKASAEGARRPAEARSKRIVCKVRSGWDFMGKLIIIFAGGAGKEKGRIG